MTHDELLGALERNQLHDKMREWSDEARLKGNWCVINTNMYVRERELVRAGSGFTRVPRRVKVFMRQHFAKIFGCFNTMRTRSVWVADNPPNDDHDDNVVRVFVVIEDCTTGHTTAAPVAAGPLEAIYGACGAHTRYIN